MSPLQFESLSHTVPPEAARWLWEPYVPRGTLCLLDGHPGIGKSLLTIDLAARLSRGAELPDGAPVNRPQVTLFLSAEDGPHIIRTRALAAGADLDRILTPAAGSVPLSLPAHVSVLEEQIRACRADLVVIDPIMAFLAPEASANLDQCVRRALGPLAAVAEATGCAILLVRHLRKAETPQAVLRGQGSIGFIATARTGLLASRHPADPTLGVLAVSKSNVAGRVPSLSYRVKADAENRAVVEWLGRSSLSADSLGATPESQLRPRDWASAWLLGELATGPRPASEVLAAAVLAGIPERTLRRAKSEASVRAHCAAGKQGNVWYWYDTSAPWPATAPFRKPFELPPLD